MFTVDAILNNANKIISLSTMCETETELHHICQFKYTTFLFTFYENFCSLTSFVQLSGFFFFGLFTWVKINRKKPNTRHWRHYYKHLIFDNKVEGNGKIMQILHNNDGVFITFTKQKSIILLLKTKWQMHQRKQPVIRVDILNSSHLTIQKFSLIKNCQSCVILNLIISL
jgi:hypothetical protein